MTGIRPADVDAAELFRVLADETRLAILFTLWNAHDPSNDGDALPFSELHARVGRGASGNFNYHLRKLRGRFVRKTDGGYELRQSGRLLVRAVIARDGVEDTTFEPTPVSVPCPHCGGGTAVSYEDDSLIHVCTECEGRPSGADTDEPDGFLSSFTLYQAGLRGRTPDEMYAARVVRDRQIQETLAHGVCHGCCGRVESTLSVCPDHDATDGPCVACGRPEVARIVRQCVRCTTRVSQPPAVAVLSHPAVVAFYYDHGVTVDWDVDDVDTLVEVTGLPAGHETAVRSTTPPAVTVTVRYEGDELRLTVDEHGDVREAAG